MVTLDYYTWSGKEISGTFKEREMIEDVFHSTFDDLILIDLEGVNHVEMDSSVINKL